MQDNMPVLKNPKPRRRGSRRLIAILFLLFAVLLLVLFIRSPISKIDTISVTGGQFVRGDEIREAAGVSAGDPFFYPTAEMIAKRIEKLAPIEDASVEKKFPGELHIEVTEYPAVAFELSSNGDIRVILSNGAELSAGSDSVVDKPVLREWEDRKTLKAQLTKALGGMPEDLLSDFSEIVPYPSDAYPDRIKIYTRTRFEVVTAVSLIGEKAETIRAVIETQEPGNITLLLADRYVPYAESESDDETDE